MTKCGSPHQTADKMTKQLGHAAKTLRLSDKTARLFFGPVKIYAQNYLQARLSEVNRQ